MFDCTSCHGGDSESTEKSIAHQGLNTRPSDDPETCGECHTKTAKTYTLALHYSTAGMKAGVRPRFSDSEAATYDAKVFEQSCRSCHASCGDCHVKSPIISGVNLGLLAGHKFVRKDESKTCALCHGGRVYPEYTGEYGGQADVHYQKGMTCTDCHGASELHGSKGAQTDRRSVADKPSCTACHVPGTETTKKAKEAHATHSDTVSCSACHSSTSYRGCASCHLGEGATSSPMFLLGDNPRKPGQLTTLRLVPTVRDTFKKVGIAQENFDALPNLWDTVPHNTRKRTERTRDCDTCHSERLNFLEEEKLPADGSSANRKLIFRPAH
jgi:thiosulfate/3-mercaptopyruvate sulfurtransferase